MHILVLFVFVLLVLVYNLLYIDNLSASYRNGRSEKLDDRFRKRLYFGLQLAAHTLTLASLTSFARFIVPLPVSDWVRLFGLLIMILALVLIRFAKWSLGSNYSPCQDSYLPPSITSMGPYAYIRHPLYSANILYFVGMTLVSKSAFLILVLCLLVWFFNRSARVEEDALGSRFSEYASYKKRTKRFIPFIY